MGLFGGSTTKTNQQSTQYGVSDQGVLVGDGSNYTANYATSSVNEFPETVAQFAEAALGLAGQATGSAVAQSQEAISTLSTVASRQKTPLTEWAPIIAIGAVGLVAIAYIMR